MAMTHEQIISTEIQAVPVIDKAQFMPLKDIPGLLDQTTAVINEKLLAMQALRSLPSLTDEQLHQFGDLAHALKSGLVMIGCVRIALVCGKMELFGRRNRYRDPAMLIQTYDHLFFPVLQETMVELASSLGAY